jgi:chromosome segregation ATPase
MTDQGLLERAKKLGIDIRDTKILVDSIEGARSQLSTALDEMRMTSTVLRERINWLIRELDALQKEIKP